MRSRFGVLSMIVVAGVAGDAAARIQGLSEARERRVRNEICRGRSGADVIFKECVEDKLSRYCGAIKTEVFGLEGEGRVQRALNEARSNADSCEYEIRRSRSVGGNIHWTSAVNFWDVASNALEWAYKNGAKPKRHRLLEAWEKLKNLSCGDVVEKLSHYDPLQRALERYAPNFVGECAVQFRKGFVCEIPVVIKGAAVLLNEVAKSAWDNKFACGAAAIATFEIAPVTWLACGLSYLIVKKAPAIMEGAKRIWKCITHLRTKDWARLISGAACEFAGAIALDIVLAALTEGAAVPKLLEKFAHLAEKLLHAAGGKPGSALRAFANEVGHACNAHGEGTGGGGHGGGGGEGHGGGGVVPPHGGGGGGGGGGGQVPGYPKWGYANGDGVRLRKQDSKNSDILARASRCAPLRITGPTIVPPAVVRRIDPNDWVPVEYDGKRGYMAAKFVKVGDPATCRRPDGGAGVEGYVAKGKTGYICAAPRVGSRCGTGHRGCTSIGMLNEVKYDENNAKAADGTVILWLKAQIGREVGWIPLLDVRRGPKSECK